MKNLLSLTILSLLLVGTAYAQCAERTGVNQAVVIAHDAWGDILEEGDSLFALSADGSLCVGKAAVPGAGNFTITLWGASVLPGGDELPGLDAGEGWGLLVQRSDERHAVQKRIANGVDTFDPNAPFALIDSLWWSGEDPFGPGEEPKPEPEPEPPADTTDVVDPVEPPADTTGTEEPPAEEPEPEPEPVDPDTLRFTWMGESGRIPDWRENPLSELPADQERWSIRQEGFVPGNVGFSWVDYRWVGADSASVAGAAADAFSTEIQGDTLRLSMQGNPTLIHLWGRADTLAFVHAEAIDRAGVETIPILPAPIGREPHEAPEPEPEPEPPAEPEEPTEPEEPEEPTDPVEPPPADTTDADPVMPPQDSTGTGPEPPVDPEPEPEPEEPEPLPGDIDGSGTLDLTDVILLLDQILQTLRAQ